MIVRLLPDFFPEKTDAAEFLNLFNVWWTISNSKKRDNFSHRLGNAAVVNDRKPQFLRKFADWVEKWDNMKIPNCEKFNLSAQTSEALRRTLRCHASLIEDLLAEGYQYVLTARLQSDPLGRMIRTIPTNERRTLSRIFEGCFVFRKNP